MRTQAKRLGWLFAFAILTSGALRAGVIQDFTTNENSQFSENTGVQTSRVASQKAVPSPGAAESHVNDYRNMEDILKLEPDSGNTVILRTDQKIGLNQYVPYLIPIKNLGEAGVRELRPVARRICGLEGGFAQVVVDRKSGERFVQITCTPRQAPFVAQAISALDKKWLNSTDNGRADVVYKANYRDVEIIDQLSRAYTGGVSQVDHEDNAVVHENTISYANEYLKAAKEIDIPVHEITVEAKFYEIATNNDLKLGLDFIEWKNELGFDLFNFGFSGETVNGDASSDHFWFYNAVLSSNFYDFLATKGKAKLLANAAIQTVSGQTGEWNAMEPVQTITVSGAISGGSGPGLTKAGDIDRDKLIDFAMKTIGTYNDSGVFIPVYTREEMNLFTNEYILALLKKQIISPYSASQSQWPEAGPRSGLETDFVAVLESQLKGEGNVSFGKDFDRFVNFKNHGQIGLDLFVLPIVGSESTEMFVFADSQNLDGYTPNGQPMISESQVKTTIRVKDGQRLVLAGLTRMEKVNQKNGVPWLSDLPVVGYLFGGETKVDRTKKIVVVLDVTISAGMVAPDSGRPLSKSEVAALKNTGRFGDMAPKSMKPSEEMTMVKSQAEGVEKLETPRNRFGFDQWLLDPEKAGVGSGGGARVGKGDMPSSESSQSDVSTSQTVDSSAGTGAGDPGGKNDVASAKTSDSDALGIGRDAFSLKADAGSGHWTPSADKTPSSWFFQEGKTQEAQGLSNGFTH